jgi:hypothetical protein
MDLLGLSESPQLDFTPFSSETDVEGGGERKGEKEEGSRPI